MRRLITVCALGAVAAGVSAADCGDSNGSGGGDVLASELQLYNDGDATRALGPLTGNYMITYGSGGQSSGVLRGTSLGSDPIIILRNFREVGEAVTITVPGATRTCHVAAVAEELTYLSASLQFDPTAIPGESPPPENEVICLCGFQENPGLSCSP